MVRGASGKLWCQVSIGGICKALDFQKLMSAPTRREILRGLMSAAVLGAVSPARSLASEGLRMPGAQAPKGRAAIKTRMFWTWDHSTEWALNLAGSQTFGAANDYRRTTEAFLHDYTGLLHWCGSHSVDAVVVWGLLRDSHGGINIAKKLADMASSKGVRLLCGVGLNSYGGVYYEGDSPYSLEQHLGSHPELAALDEAGNKMNRPHQCVACPSRLENQEFAAESLTWLFKNLPLGGVQIESGDYAVCHCDLCQKRRQYPSSRFSWEDMVLMYPIATEAIRSVSPDAWIVCETYSHPEPYDGPKRAPGFGEGKPVWADQCLEQFPKGKTIFVQWACDDYVKPKGTRQWTYAGKVSDAQHHNIMRAHFGTYWAGHSRGELSIDWIAEMVQRSLAHGFDAISLFGEVSPFDTGAELNYLALESYGSAANPDADLEVFLKDVAAPLLDGNKYAHDYLRYARLSDNRRKIPGGLKEIYARCGSLPPDVARRWVWLANYLASFSYSYSTSSV